jgi:hypothetical protein
MRITYHGMNGTGRNITEARRDAGLKIEQALSGSYDPVLLPLPDGTILVGFRTPTDGWSYWFWRDGRLAGGCLCGSTTRDELERRMRRHAAQSTEDPRYLDHPSCTPRDHQDLQDHLAWQRRYQAAKAMGFTDTDAHAYACSPPQSADTAGTLPPAAARL